MAPAAGKTGENAGGTPDSDRETGASGGAAGKRRKSPVGRRFRTAGLTVRLQSVTPESDRSPARRTLSVDAGGR